jgi:hypothetical protein
MYQLTEKNNETTTEIVQLNIFIPLGEPNRVVKIDPNTGLQDIGDGELFELDPSMVMPQNFLKPGNFSNYQNVFDGVKTQFNGSVLNITRGLINEQLVTVNNAPNRIFQTYNRIDGSFAFVLKTVTNGKINLCEVYGQLFGARNHIFINSLANSIGIAKRNPGGFVPMPEFADVTFKVTHYKEYVYGVGGLESFTTTAVFRKLFDDSLHGMSYKDPSNGEVIKGQNELQHHMNNSNGQTPQQQPNDQQSQQNVGYNNQQQQPQQGYADKHNVLSYENNNSDKVININTLLPVLDGKRAENVTNVHERMIESRDAAANAIYGNRVNSSVGMDTTQIAGDSTEASPSGLVRGIRDLVDKHQVDLGQNPNDPDLSRKIISRRLDSFGSSNQCGVRFLNGNKKYMFDFSHFAKITPFVPDFRNTYFVRRTYGFGYVGKPLNNVLTMKFLETQAFNILQGIVTELFSSTLNHVHFHATNDADKIRDFVEALGANNKGYTIETADMYTKTLFSHNKDGGLLNVLVGGYLYTIWAAGGLVMKIMEMPINGKNYNLMELLTSISTNVLLPRLNDPAIISDMRGGYNGHMYYTELVVEVMLNGTASIDYTIGGEQGSWVYPAYILSQYTGNSSNETIYHSDNSQTNSLQSFVMTIDDEINKQIRVAQGGATSYEAAMNLGRGNNAGQNDSPTQQQFGGQVPQMSQQQQNVGNVSQQTNVNMDFDSMHFDS